VDTKHVCFIFFPTQAVLSVQHCVDGAGDGVLVWLRRDLIGSSAPEAVGVACSGRQRSLWFDIYFALSVRSLCAAWMLFAPHPWALWSILGSALILFTSYFQVQVSVAINSWYGPFYDLVQGPRFPNLAPVTVERFYSELSTFAGIAFRRGRGRRDDAVLRPSLHLPLVAWR